MIGISSNHQLHIFRVALVTVLVTIALLLVLFSVYLSRVQLEHEKERMHAQLQTIALVIEQFLSKTVDTSLQVTSRTRIRQELEKYNQGKITLDQVTRFSTAKLNDALRSSPIANGLVRYSLSGVVVATLGERIPNHVVAEASEFDSTPLFFQGEAGSYIVVRVEIINRKRQVVGVDVVRFDVSTLSSRLQSMAERLPDGVLIVELAHPDGESLEAGVLSPDRRYRIVTGRGLDESGLEEGLFSTSAPIMENTLNVRFMTYEEQVKNLAWRHASPVLLYLMIGIFSIVGVSFPFFMMALRQIGVTQNELKQQARKTEQALNELHRSEATKDEFLAVMSHELRTPLTTIIGNSELLSEQESDSGKLELIRSIEMAGNSQLALVNDILDMSKIESGKFVIEDSPFDLSQLLFNIQRMFDSRIRDAGLEFVLKERTTQQNKLIGDAMRIGQILNNLISNVIKFTERGRVSLTVWNDDRSLYFQVEDSGIGMSPGTVGQLFQRFEQADGSISRRFGGSGLGLYISDSLAHLMGGRIEVSSLQGIGSTFCLILPYRQSEILAARYQEPMVSSSLPGASFNGSVLVAEDTLALQLLERRILENLGLQVTTADHGKEVLELVMERDFDLILMDMQMPVMDGIEATRKVREMGNSTPIVALTANVFQKHREQFQAAGCDGFLAKPIDRSELVGILRRFLGASKPHAHGMVEEEVDEELMTIFMEGVIESRSQLSAACSRAEWENVKSVAHMIKGSGASFGFPVLTEAAKQVCDAYDNGQVERLSDLTQHLIDQLDVMIS